MPEGQTYRLILTEEAVVDLDRLDLFLRPVNPAAADRFQDTVWAALQQLVAHPRCGRPWPLRPGGQDIRELFVPFGKRAYVLRYRLSGTEILFIRIHHAREDR